MRRKREPGTRNPLSCPLSKQRMIVCWLTLQILAASPVVKTVFMVEYAPFCELMGSLAPSPASLGVPKALRRTPFVLLERLALHGDRPVRQAPERPPKP